PRPRPSLPDHSRLREVIRAAEKRRPDVARGRRPPEIGDLSHRSVVVRPFAPCLHIGQGAEADVKRKPGAIITDAAGGIVRPGTDRLSITRPSSSAPLARANPPIFSQESETFVRERHNPARLFRKERTEARFSARQRLPPQTGLGARIPPSGRRHLRAVSILSGHNLQAGVATNQQNRSTVNFFLAITARRG